MWLRNQALKCSNTFFYAGTDAEKIQFSAFFMKALWSFSNPNPCISTKRGLEGAVGDKLMQAS